MTYIRVKWIHSFPDEPVLLYSELDDERWEVRKVEVFRDGRQGFASQTNNARGSILGEAPVPSIEEIAADTQFEPREITQNEFEQVWDRRHHGFSGGDTPSDDRERLRRAAEYWRDGQPLAAGRLIFERIPSNSRPRWAAAILRLVLERGGCAPHPLCLRVLHDADRPELWGNGHYLSDKLREFCTQDDLSGRVFDLAVIVARVMYNSSNPADEFDEDTGWYIAHALKRVVDRAGLGEEFAASAWAALSAQPG